MIINKMNDREILTGLVQNDQFVTQYVYKTLAPPLFKFVLSNNGSKEDAKDIFQETYLKVLLNIRERRYTDKDKFEAYFLTIARNTWLDHLRARKNGLAPLDYDALLEQADTSDSDALIQLVLHDKRMDALHRVWGTWEDTDCRRILHNFHYEHQRTKDIALTEQITQNTLLQRLFKCRQKLFRLVEQQLT
jgi:RNA polymerase sigma factor (sigma-70 family)